MDGYEIRHYHVGKGEQPVTVEGTGRLNGTGDSLNKLQGDNGERVGAPRFVYESDGTPKVSDPETGVRFAVAPKTEAKELIK